MKIQVYACVAFIISQLLASECEGVNKCPYSTKAEILRIFSRGVSDPLSTNPVDKTLLVCLFGEHLCGHVPKKVNGLDVYDFKGVVISIGLDLGVQTIESLNSLKLAQELTNKLSPYVGIKGAAAEEKLKSSPLKINQQESDQIYTSLRKANYEELTKNFESENKSAKFQYLPNAIQTAIFAMKLEVGNIKAHNPSAWTSIVNLNYTQYEEELQKLIENTSLPFSRLVEKTLVSSDSVNFFSTPYVGVALDPSISFVQFPDVTTFLVSLVEYLPSNTLLAVYNYPGTVLEFEDLKNKTKIIDEILNIQYMAGTPYIEKAITNLTTAINTNDPRATKHIIVLTTGQNSDNPASAVKLAATNNIKLSEVYLGTGKASNLTESSVEHHFETSDSSLLGLFAKPIVSLMSSTPLDFADKMTLKVDLTNSKQKKMYFKYNGASDKMLQIKADGNSKIYVSSSIPYPGPIFNNGYFVNSQKSKFMRTPGFENKTQIFVGIESQSGELTLTFDQCETSNKDCVAMTNEEKTGSDNTVKYIVLVLLILVIIGAIVAFFLYRRHKQNIEVPKPNSDHLDGPLNPNPDV